MRSIFQLALAQGFIRMIGVIVFFAYWILNTLGWLVNLCFLALLMLAIASIMGCRAHFSGLLVLGIYAFVPASYLVFVLDLVNINFWGLRLLFLLAIWIFLMLRLLELKQPSTQAQVPTAG